jgi:hypothetical protein
MAVQKSTSGSRPARNDALLPAGPAPSSALKAPGHAGALRPDFDALEDIIETQRARLMTAHSLMSCISLAMDAEQGIEGPVPYYPGLVELARDLVDEAIRGLDTVSLAPVLGDLWSRNSTDYAQRKVEPRAKDEVRESASLPYLC